MSRHGLTALGFSLALGMTSSGSHAIEVVGKQLEFYGVMHVSLDYLDSDVSRAVAKQNGNDALTDGELSVSSNISRVGIRGEQMLSPELTVLYQLEQTINLDGSNGDSLTSRNSFLGIRGRYGELLAGRYDTLFKLVGTQYSLLNDTIADRGAIIGAVSGVGNLLDRRAENMLMWRDERDTNSGRWLWALQYSADSQRSAGSADNNDRKLLGGSLTWQGDSQSATLAHDHYTELAGGTIDATRLGLQHREGRLTANLILERVRHDLDVGGHGLLDRNAVAVNVGWKQGGFNWIVQVMEAADFAGVSDSGALKLSFGLEKMLAPSLKTYVVYTQTDNDRNAAYQGVDGTHGDELATTPGNDPSALSAGLRFAF
ncbi:porin [Litorivivens sp.]|uniref:porin n=1 Tax=Litorivivens sp. TaxID=2020868 RepID=UPI00356649E7